LCGDALRFLAADFVTDVTDSAPIRYAKRPLPISPSSARSKKRGPPERRWRIMWGMGRRWYGDGESAAIMGSPKAETALFAESGFAACPRKDRGVSIFLLGLSSLSIDTQAASGLFAN
jgi:hypothetical protein